jgi:threonyl-tRNA synthetase
MDMNEKADRLERIRHSASHVMADAVKRLYPGVKLGIGPAISDGFYYDLDFSECEVDGERKKDFLTPEDLPAIEKEMKSIIKEDLPFSKKNMKKEEALEFFREKGEIYKIELIETFPTRRFLSTNTVVSRIYVKALMLKLRERSG